MEVKNYFEYPDAGLAFKAKYVVIIHAHILGLRFPCCVSLPTLKHKMPQQTIIFLLLHLHVGEK